MKQRYNGVCIDSLPHSVFVARWILGDVELVGGVKSKLTDLKLDVDDVAAILLKGPNGEPCYLLADYVRNPRQFYVRAVTTSGVYQWEFTPKHADAMYYRQMDVFQRIIKGQWENDYPTLADGMAVQEVIDAVAGC